MGKSDISVVLRFPNVALSRSELEARIGRGLDRFEAGKGHSHYGQINIPESTNWTEITGSIESIGLSISSSIASGEIGRPCADFCNFLTAASHTFLIPCEVAMVIARSGFDIEVSTYATS